MLRSVAAFCGSSPGARPGYAEAARALGAEIAGRGMRLVYGGAHVGLMGIVADAAIAAGGDVVGVIPRDLVAREVAHTGLADLRVVESMHERKQLITDLSDGFIALPGGLGTLEEIFEILTWGQLGLHAKPCAMLDAEGYFGRLASFLDHAVEERFVRPQHRSMLLVDACAPCLLDRMEGYVAPAAEKWIDRSAT